MWKMVLSVLLSLFLTLPLYASEEEIITAPYKLNPIIVTAAKIPQREEYITQKIDVVEREEFPNIAYDYGDI